MSGKRAANVAFTAPACASVMINLDLTPEIFRFLGYVQGCTISDIERAIKKLYPKLSDLTIEQLLSAMDSLVDEPLQRVVWCFSEAALHCVVKDLYCALCNMSPGTCSEIQYLIETVTGLLLHTDRASIEELLLNEYVFNDPSIYLQILRCYQQKWHEFQGSASTVQEVFAFYSDSSLFADRERNTCIKIVALIGKCCPHLQ